MVIRQAFPLEFFLEIRRGEAVFEGIADETETFHFFIVYALRREDMHCVHSRRR